jgi:hypothetical protein
MSLFNLSCLKANRSPFDMSTPQGFGTGYALVTGKSNSTTTGTSGTSGPYTIGGTISGLVSDGLVLKNNTDTLTITKGTSSFSFSTPVASGSSYTVTIQTQPLLSFCTINNASGIVSSANVNNIIVTCNCYSWGCFTDNMNGTIKFTGIAGTFGGNTYTAQTLTWMKCTQGRVWNSVTNDCTGIGTSADYYGATPVNYCNENNETCNNTTTKLLNGLGTSGAWTACNNNNASSTFGINTWRVPTKEELKTLIHCPDYLMPMDNGSCSPYIFPSINKLFSETIASLYWSSTSVDTTSAWVVGFGEGVVLNGRAKTTTSYIRCVSGL